MLLIQSKQQDYNGYILMWQLTPICLTVFLDEYCYYIWGPINLSMMMLIQLDQEERAPDDGDYKSVDINC